MAVCVNWLCVKATYVGKLFKRYFGMGVVRPVIYKNVCVVVCMGVSDSHPEYMAKL